MTSTTQRIQQGVRALLAFATPLDSDLAQQYLSPAEFDAFQQMARAEQLHSLNVLRDVLAQLEETPDPLAVAALLHDVGKSRYHLAVWQKTISVLMKQFAPTLVARINQSERLTFWSAPFIVREKHPQWSADILETCESDPIATWLVLHHQESAKIYQNHPNYPLLVRLQQADNAN